MDGTNIGPNFSPPPIPIPGVSKSLLPGMGKNKHMFDGFPSFLLKKQKPARELTTNMKTNMLLSYYLFYSKNLTGRTTFEKHIVDVVSSFLSKIKTVSLSD